MGLFKVDRSTPKPDTLRQPHGLQSLCDLEIGDVKSRDTSYLGEQNEVRDMVRAVSNERNPWPGYWYEILQGALDFNDWSKGPPEIKVYYEGNEEPVSYVHFLSDQKKVGSKIVGVLGLKKISKVEVCNHIRRGEGLRPGNVVLTQHDSKEEDQTLGAHGRGLKIATTATYAGKLAKGITFRSWVPEVGAWYGEAGLVKDPVDPKSPEFFQLKYKRDQSIFIDETIITVHEPGKALIDALSVLPQWFLPANSAYEYCRMEPQQNSRVPNRYTVFANRYLVRKPNQAGFEPHQLRSWGLESLTGTEGTEPPRVEILPAELTGTTPINIDFMYVDGLRVKVEGVRFAHVYSVWGFRNGIGGYNPRRSNDSLLLLGDAKGLLANSIALCRDPEILADTLQANINQTVSTSEGYFYSWDLAPLYNSSDGRRSVEMSWQTLRQRLGIFGDAYVTSSSESYKRARREGKPTVYINSQGWVSILAECVPNLQTVDAVFEAEATQEKAKLDAERRRAVELAANAERDKQRAIKEAIEAERRARGVLVEAQATGEVILVEAERDPMTALEIIQLQLINTLALHRGRLIETDVASQAVFVMNSGAFDRVPTNVRQLDAVGGVVQTAISLFGDTIDFEVRVTVHGNGVFFKFTPSKGIDSRGNYAMQVQQGKLIADTGDEVRLILTPKNANVEGSGTTQVSKDYLHFISQMGAACSSLQDDAGHIVLDRYVQSTYYDRYPPARTLIRMRRAQEEITQRTKDEFAAMNELRRKAGLPLLEDPFAKSEKSIEGTSLSSDELYRDTPLPETHIMGDVSIAEPILYLIRPDSVPGLSQYGETERRQILLDERTYRERLRQLLTDRLKEVLQRQIAPDFTLASGDHSKIRGYLISHINPERGGITTADYQIMPPLPFQDRRGCAKLRFNKKIAPGLNTLLCPPGYRPVAYSHPGGSRAITFAGHSESNMYAFSIQEEMPAGLTFYYEKRDDYKDTTQPSTKQLEVGATIDGLADHWMNLINAINESQLSPKEKTDVIIRAWVKAFNYDKTQKTYDLYENVRDMPNAFRTEIINQAIGNCGYATQGLLGLFSLAHIPVRDVACFLSDGFGNFSRMHNYHGTLQVFLNDQWVLIEPQVGYLEDGFNIDNIPDACRDQYKSLLEAIPDRPPEAIRQLEELPDILPDQMAPIRNLRDEIVAALIEMIPVRSSFSGIPSLLEVLRSIRSEIDMERANRTELSGSQNSINLKEAFKQTAKFIPIAVIGGFIVSRLIPFLSNIKLPTSDVMQNPQVQDVIQEIGKDIGHIPTQYVVATLLLGGGAYTAGYIKGKRSNLAYSKSQEQEIGQILDRSEYNQDNAIL